MSIKERLDALKDGLRNIDKAKEEPVDANAIILGNYLQGFIPVDSFSAGVTIITTDDIISSRSAMADLSQEDVNRVLATLGYKPGRNDAGSFGWMMKRISI